MKKKASILTAIVLMISFAAGASAQEARKLRQLSDSPNIPQFEQDVTVRLRLVDVTAIDSSGLSRRNHVDGGEGRRGACRRAAGFHAGAQDRSLL